MKSQPKKIIVTIAEFETQDFYGTCTGSAVFLSRGYLDDSHIKRFLGADRVNTRFSEANDADTQGVDLKKWKSGFLRIR